ncbi:uncharacterized protein BDV14DRAFT_196268 [Aspergillus stella-maris]|uniref:uncharacterized protein n=1 Tax=Aspergillus stella-maris TaxID=1810926 RepID=UPI003CCD2BC5
MRLTPAVVTASTLIPLAVSIPNVYIEGSQVHRNFGSHNGPDAGCLRSCTPKEQACPMNMDATKINERVQSWIGVVHATSDLSSLPSRATAGPAA